MKRIITLAAVVLTLTVASLQADKSAGEIVDDSWLHAKVKAAMVGHGSSGVNVEVYHGVVQLAGFLSGDGNKENLIKSVEGVEGVKRISDQLHVVKGDRSAGTVVDDNTATAAVKATLVDAGLMGINVEVNRGQVLLSGFVDNDDVRAEAIDLTRGLKGVAGVIDGMDLKS